MNLYDIMGPVAVAGGAGVSYGSSSTHGLACWSSLVLGVTAGCATFLALRRITGRTQSERLLGVLYPVTFVGTLAATVVVAWLARLVAGS